MNEKISKTLKSSETEDWLDYHVVRPLCYYLTVFFAKLGIHPNTVTILSMIVGAASCVFFASGCFYYEGTTGLVMNLIAIAMLIVADLLDCTDGQLARMTGKKSRLGRILDGMAGFVWFVPIYTALVWRFYQHHALEFSWLGIADTEPNALVATAVVFVLALISGFLGGLGGIVYITAGVSEWKFEMGVAGFGFLALAVMIFGQWKPTRIALAALLFGLFRALSNTYVGFPSLAALNIPGNVYNMMPYIVSLIVLALTSKNSRAPKAEGIPYDKGSR